MIIDNSPDVDSVGNFGGSSGGAAYDDSALRADVNLKINKSEKGVANGVATLDSSGLIPSTQLPSYVDDVLEFATFASLPTTGESGKIYVVLATNLTYRWGGTDYVKITSGDVASVAGKTGIVTLAKGDVGLGLVDNTSDSTKNVLTATKLFASRTFTFSGGATGSTTFDGSANVTINLTVDLSSCLKTNDSRITGWESASTNNHSHTNKAVLDATNASFTTAKDTKLTGIAVNANNYAHPVSGVVAGDYKSVTVNTNGHITAGTNPDTLSGFGITDAYTREELDALLSALSNRLAALETP